MECNPTEVIEEIKYIYNTSQVTTTRKLSNHKINI